MLYILTAHFQNLLLNLSSTAVLPLQLHDFLACKHTLKDEN